MEKELYLDHGRDVTLARPPVSQQDDGSTHKAENEERTRGYLGV